MAAKVPMVQVMITTEGSQIPEDIRDVIVRTIHEWACESIHTRFGIRLQGYNGGYGYYFTTPGITIQLNHLHVILQQLYSHHKKLQINDKSGATVTVEVYDPVTPEDLEPLLEMAKKEEAKKVETEICQSILLTGKKIGQKCGRELGKCPYH